MKIKILHQYHNNMLDTYRALAQGNDVEFLSHRISKLIPGISNRAPLMWGRPAFMYQPRSLWSLLKGADVVVLKHINNPLNILPLLFAPILGYRPVVIVQRISHRSFPGYRVLWQLMITWLNVLRADVICVTSPSYQHLKPRIRRISYLPAAIDAARFELAAFPPQETLRVLTVGKWQPRKQLPTLLQAIGLLKNKYPKLQLQLTIIANQTSHPTSKREYELAQQLVDSLQLRDSIQIIADVGYEDMAALYATSHLFILPARHEPLGYAVVEAMAAGLPVIVSEDAGAASYVRRGETGYLSSASSPEDIVASIERFLVDGLVNWPLLEEMGHRGRADVFRGHSAVRWVEYLEKVTK